MVKNILFCGIVGCFFLLNPFIYSQGLYNISGFVKEKITGEPLVGTNVLIYKDTIDITKPPFAGAASNNFGFYVIPKIPAGDYFLIVRYIGFKPVIKEINLTSQKGNLSLNIEMSAENIRLEEVVVTGEKEDKVGLSRIDVSPELLAKLPSLTGEVDLFKLLQMLPGVKSANELSNGLYVRGGSPDQTLTLVDGVILYNPAHLGNISSTFNSNAIRNVTLIKGGFPAQYGGRLSSVLDIKLRSGTKEKEQGVIGLGLINSFFALEGPMSDNATYMVAARGMYYDALQKKFQKESSTPRYNFYDLNAKINYEFSNNSIVSISGLFNNDKVYSPGGQGIDYNITWENTILSLGWLHINSKSLMLNSTFSFVNYKFKSIIGQDPNSNSQINYFSASDLSDLNFRQDAEIKWHQDHTFKMGMELSIHNYSLLYSDRYDPLIEEDPNAGSKLTSIEGALYVQSESQLTPLLKTNFGGRIYYFGENKFFDIEPRFSISYALSENLFVKSGYAIAHQFLHLITKNDISLPTDLWYPSTKNIEPSKSSQYGFGVDYYLGEQEYLISVEAYYKDMKNLYEFSSSARLNALDSITNQFTKGEGQAYGVELFFNKRAGNFNGWIGYTLSWSKRKFDYLNSGKVFYPKYDRRNDLSVVLAYNISESLTAGLTWVFASGARYTLPPEQYLFGNIGLGGTYLNLNEGKLNASIFPDYHKLDLNLTYKFQWLNKIFDIYLNLYNVYNRQNPFALYPVLTNNSSTGSGQKAKFKKLTLFPFIPTIGFNYKF